VVAENPEHAERRRDAGKAADEEVGVDPAAVDLIAGEDDEIGRQRVDQVADPEHPVDRHVGAGVDVGDLQDRRPSHCGGSVGRSRVVARSPGRPWVAAKPMLDTPSEPAARMDARSRNFRRVSTVASSGAAAATREPRIDRA